MSAKWELDEPNGIIKSNGQIIAKVFDTKNAGLIASVPEIVKLLRSINSGETRQALLHYCRANDRNRKLVDDVDDLLACVDGSEAK